MKIIIDTNIIFSALLNSNSRISKILLNSKDHFQFYSCEYLKTEMLRHWKKLLKLTKLTEIELTELEEIITNKITFINERLLPQELLLKTEKQLESIDSNDTAFVTLTKHL
jgi:predicted nucleic acid-binding protein